MKCDKSCAVLICKRLSCVIVIAFHVTKTGHPDLDFFRRMWYDSNCKEEAPAGWKEVIEMRNDFFKEIGEILDIIVEL